MKSVRKEFAVGKLFSCHNFDRFLSDRAIHKDDKPMIKTNLSHFSIQQISESGQCFRMNRIAENRYALIAFGRYLEVEQTGRDLLFACTQEEYDGIWREYFDLDNDYGRYRSTVSEQDLYLAEAMAFGSGIRILHQDVWEMLISFIISQQNNIRRIRTCIETLCERYGRKMCVANGGTVGEAADGGKEKDDESIGTSKTYYTFPDVQSLASATEEELRECNLGYRSRYIVNTANSILCGDVDLEAVKKMEYKRARGELLKLCGVGEKVADCICLFGLHHMDAFPVDTHIRKAIEEHYPTGFPFERYDGFAGVMQQYIFYYDLKNSSGIVKE